MKQSTPIYALLLADDPSAIDGAAEHPIDGAVTVIGAAIAILAERAAEFRDHHDHGIVPLASQRLREHLQTPPQTGQVGGERALRCLPVAR